MPTFLQADVGKRIQTEYTRDVKEFFENNGTKR